MLMMFSFYWFQVAFGGEGYLKMLGIRVGGVETDLFSAAETRLPAETSFSGSLLVLGLPETQPSTKTNTLGTHARWAAVVGSWRWRTHTG